MKIVAVAALIVSVVGGMFLLAWIIGCGRFLMLQRKSAPIPLGLEPFVFHTGIHLGMLLAADCVLRANPTDIVPVIAELFCALLVVPACIHRVSLEISNRSRPGVWPEHGVTHLDLCGFGVTVFAALWVITP